MALVVRGVFVYHHKYWREGSVMAEMLARRAKCLTVSYLS